MSNIHTALPSISVINTTINIQRRQHSPGQMLDSEHSIIYEYIAQWFLTFSDLYTPCIQCETSDNPVNFCTYSYFGFLSKMAIGYRRWEYLPQHGHMK